MTDKHVGAGLVAGSTGLADAYEDAECTYKDSRPKSSTF